MIVPYFHPLKVRIFRPFCEIRLLGIHINSPRSVDAVDAAKMSLAFSQPSSSVGFVVYDLLKKLLRKGLHIIFLLSCWEEDEGRSLSQYAVKAASGAHQEILTFFNLPSSFISSHHGCNPIAPTRLISSGPGDMPFGETNHGYSLLLRRVWRPSSMR